MPAVAVEDSILLSIKKLNNVSADFTAFDQDFVIYINSAISTLTQLGIGPLAGYQITDENDFWTDFIGEDFELNAVKTYIGLRVRLLFDPPRTSYAIAMMEKQLEEHAWRLNEHYEHAHAIDPDPDVDLRTILMGGGA